MSNFTKISLIIPAYYATKELEEMTQRCIDSVGPIDELILQIDETGEGYTKTTNKALHKSTGDIIIIGNNDLIFPENWITELLFPLNLGFEIATCWTSDQDNIKLQDKIEDGAYFGSLFAMHRHTYEILGDFDERFKGYFADTDYRARVIKNGMRIGKNLNLVVEHLARATYKLVDDADEEYQRAKIIYEIKHGEMA